MVKTMGVEPKKFMSQGVPVKALYSRGVKVWPVQPVEGDTDFSITINSGADSSFILPTSGYLNFTPHAYAWIVDWGDGNITTENGTGGASGIAHAYPQANTLYEIKILPQNPSELGWLRAFGFGADIPSNNAKVRVVNGQLTERMIRISEEDNAVCFGMFSICVNLVMSKTFNLPQDITRVGSSFCEMMFFGCENLRMNEVFNLPQGITSIGDRFCLSMFTGCTNLLTMGNSFNLPQGIVGDAGSQFCWFMFRGCFSLTMNAIFNLPQGITECVDYFCSDMFGDCTNLAMNEIFNLPQAMTKAGSWFCWGMFSGCTSLTMNDVINLPQGITGEPNVFCGVMFRFCINLKMNGVFQLPQSLTGANAFCQGTFADCVSITTGVRQFFGNIRITAPSLNAGLSYSGTFNYCTSLTENLSDIPQLQEIPSDRRATFEGCPPDLIAPLHANWK